MKIFKWYDEWYLFKDKWFTSKYWIFRLCPVHRKCAQSSFDMGHPKCDIMKSCLGQTTRVAVDAYWKTIEKANANN